MSRPHPVVDVICAPKKVEDQPQDNKAKAGKENNEQYQQLRIDGGEPKLEGTCLY